MSADKLDLILDGIGELRQITRALVARQDEMDAKLDALAMDVHLMKNEVAGLKLEVAELKQEVAELKQDVTTLKQDFAELKDGQERHERILETLALRVLEWDTYRRDQSRKK
jgi:archaellum component FlaC